jgi:hypothetical protein
MPTDISSLIDDLKSPVEPPFCDSSDSTKAISAAVCRVMEGSGVIPETGWNDYHKYKYSTDADILKALQPLMSKAGLHWRCVWLGHLRDIVKAKQPHRTRVDTVYRLHHTSGEWMDYRMAGEGADGNDKGVYKALTGAYKYLQRQAFSLPTGDDPERDKAAEKKKRESAAEKRERQGKHHPSWTDKVRASWHAEMGRIMPPGEYEGWFLPYLQEHGKPRPSQMPQGARDGWEKKIRKKYEGG